MRRIKLVFQGVPHMKHLFSVLFLASIFLTSQSVGVIPCSEGSEGGDDDRTCTIEE